jgi:hypothetical protein
LHRTQGDPTMACIFPQTHSHDDYLIDLLEESDY